MERALKLWSTLCEDPFAQQDLVSDPQAFAESFGVDPRELERLTAICDAELAGSWQRCALCGDPGNDELPDPDPPVYRD
jgi:hypothetical protein